MSDPVLATDLVDRVREGRCSAVEATRGSLRRIAASDGALNAFLRTDPRAEDRARSVDERLQRGETLSLAGLPLAVKDNILTEDLETTCGSKILTGFRPIEDATVIRRLRAAGAVVVGKTNLDEFGMGSSTETSAFGPTHNPWDLGRVPGGSSGGSAAAVAAGMVSVALGSDTGGSVRQPAAFCGVVGLKPTYGRVSRRGLVAFGSSLDQIGPIGRRVEDVALVSQVLEGSDPRDATSAPDARSPAPLEACRLGVGGLRVGLPQEYFGEGLDPEIRETIERAGTKLESEGAVVETVSLPHAPYTIPTYYLIATAEASSNLARYDGIRYGTRSARGTDLAAMLASTRGEGFGIEVKRRIMLGTFALSAGYHEAFYGKAQRVRTLIRRDFLETFGRGFDLLLSPTTPTTAFRLGEKLGDPLAMYLSDIYTVTANLAGIPALSVPVGLSRDGLPIGAQLLAPPMHESTLLRAGAVLQELFGDRRPAAAGATR